MITNTMKHTVPIPIPPFDEAVVTALFAINPPNLKVPDTISIRQDIPRVILTSTVHIQLLDKSSRETFHAFRLEYESEPKLF